MLIRTRLNVRDDVRLDIQIKVKKLSLSLLRTASALEMLQGNARGLVGVSRYWCYKWSNVLLPDPQDCTYSSSSQFIRLSILLICVREAHLIGERLAHVAQPYWPQGKDSGLKYLASIPTLSIYVYYLWSSCQYAIEPKDIKIIKFTSMSESHPASLRDPRSITHSTGQACLLGAVVFTWSLMFIAVSLRFVARRLSKMALWYDDWFIMPAAVR